MDKVFLTGATGYVGELLAKKLVEQGKKVHILVRSVAKAKKIFLDDEQFKFFEGDLADKMQINLALEDCQEVYHLAAQAKVWDKNPGSFYQMNVEGTLNILNSSLEKKVKKVVLTSTAGVLGPSVAGVVTENTVQRIPHSTEYERTKAISEKEALTYLEKGLEIVIVNPTRIYGPGQRSESNAVTKLLERYAQGKWRIMPGNGKKIGNYVFVDDVVEGHLLAMKNGKSGEKYILGGDNVSYQELFDIFGEITGKKLRLFNLPISVMMTFARLELLKANLLGKAPLITPNFVKKYLYDWHLSSEKATNELGYQITPIRDGLQRTFRWLQEGK
ncbi:MAG: SDR family oxidoreductase [Thermonemataceae bacterium]|nr:SDR family oxidoreductase [Thermonemataceae bacterium]